MEAIIFEIYKNIFNKKEVTVEFGSNLGGKYFDTRVWQENSFGQIRGYLVGRVWYG